MEKSSSCYVLRLAAQRRKPKKETAQYYWQTLILGGKEDLQEAVPWTAYNELDAAPRKLLENRGKVKSKASMELSSIPGGSPGTILEIINFLQDNTTGAARLLRAVGFLRERKWFSTACATIGFTGPGVSVGDIVFVFNGSPTPHVIRRGPDQDKEVYTFIGDANVYGLVSGEVDEMDLQDTEIVMV
ncbi:uncharacterized protein EKO05_0001839 [Ascochyta rabiei]|uniref:uncharacterized protein n=1 Tax=Didymella rabiei TaxID=5454 RepID=UPI00220395FD|nr:uncharacterized protein EKO05_0001839 [Ascochyta rabiei]UPX11219.1 hypothetical protein EKO05_0001839 [Ascochyta rabiei]